MVASNIAGFAEVAVPEVALLAPPGDVTALSQAVVSMLANEERRVAMGRAGRALVEERYSWADVARRLDEVYERIAG